MCTSWWPATGPRVRWRPAPLPSPEAPPRAIAEPAVAAVLARGTGWSPRGTTPARRRSAGTSSGPASVAPGVDRADPDPARLSGARAAEEAQERLPPPRPPNPTRPGSRLTHVRLADGTDVEVITWLDDHPAGPAPQRPPPGHRTHRARHVRASVAEHGCPASTLTDNAMVYTVRHRTAPAAARTPSRPSSSPSASPRRTPDRTTPPPPARSTPNRPSRPGWPGNPPSPPPSPPAGPPRPAATRQHRPATPPLNRRTPAAAYTARPKAAPGEPPTRTHTRIRRDKVNNGRSPCATPAPCTHRHRQAPQRTSHPRPRPRPGHHHQRRPHRRTLRQLTLDTTRRYQPHTQLRPEGRERM